SATVTVATFTDANPGASAADFAGTTITWGDGSPAGVALVIADAHVAGQFDVTGVHTYADEGAYTATASVADDGGATASATDAATVNDAALTASNGAGFTATEGNLSATVTVATFSDANLGASAADFAGTTITWGDGSAATAATVTLSSGTFSVTGTHTYADEGSYTATASIVDDGGSTASATDAATVNDAALTASNGTGFAATEGNLSATVTVATFTDANPGAVTADFAGTTIDWGDGSPATAATVTLSSGTFSAAGTHTSADERTCTATASIVDDGGAPASATDAATVHDAALTASNGTGFTATEGAGTGTVTVATFTDANPGASAADFAGTTIDWGDGTAASTALVVADSGTPGQFDVTGTHTYTEENGYVATAHIADDGGSTASATDAATVNDATLTASNGTGFTATEGNLSATVTVATFTDANPGASAGGAACRAIDWGDGSAATAATETLISNTFSLKGTHTNAEERSFTAAASVVDDGGATASATDAATVNDAALTASNGAGFTATEGNLSATVTVATFTDANPGASAADFAGTTIRSEDRRAATATRTPSSSTFSVTGTHTYAEEGSFTAAASVVDDGGATASATDAATVNDAALTASNGTGFTATEGKGTGTVTVATFTDANPGASAADFAGTTIDWGDGTAASTALVVADSGTPGQFDVTGTHTYTEENGYVATAHIADDGGSTAGATDAATVNDATLTASNGTGFPPTEGNLSATVTVATFTDANPGASAADFAGTTITWGDGATTAATVTLSSGTFSVTGTHTYAEEGSFTAAASVVDDGGATASATDAATVNDAALTASN